MNLQEISVEKGMESLSPLTDIGKRRMLITAGTSLADCNPMTASWGGLGILWNKPTVICFVRQSRHTDTFLRRTACPYFTLSFFKEASEAFSNGISICGRISGRDGNKWEKAALTPAAYRNWFFPSEADTVLCCRKLCAHLLSPDDFSDHETREAVLAGFYAKEPYHTAYYGEIETILKTKDFS